MADSTGIMVRLQQPRGCPTAIRILVGDRDETVPSAYSGVVIK